MKSLPVYETFHTWQGEGSHMGKSAFFIRLFGCPVHCPWCDSAGTWHPDYIPKVIEKRTPQELADQAVKHRPAIVVITGGEPAIHDLTDLTGLLRQKNLPTHLETSGAFEVRGIFDWITLSPKVWKMPLQSVIDLADEFKIIVDSADAVKLWQSKLGNHWRNRPVWLHPEWSKRKDSHILRLINQTVKDESPTYRAGYQLHKLYHVDEEDPAAKPSVYLA